MKVKTMPKKPNGALVVGRNRDENSNAWGYVSQTQDTGAFTVWAAANASAGTWEYFVRRSPSDTGTDTGAVSAWKPATTGGGVYVKA